jgi:hypothetical protein
MSYTIQINLTEQQLIELLRNRSTTVQAAPARTVQVAVEPAAPVVVEDAALTAARLAHNATLARHAPVVVDARGQELIPAGRRVMRNSKHYAAYVLTPEAIEQYEVGGRPHAIFMSLAGCDGLDKAMTLHSLGRLAGKDNATFSALTMLRRRGQVQIVRVPA